VRRVLVLAASVAIAPACARTLPPSGQLRLFVDTDALLPAAPGTLPDPARPALFDRLRVEVFAPDETSACDDCTRDFGIDHETVLAGRASFGITATPGKPGYRARVRLFRSGGGNVVDPRPTSTLEAVVLLPAIGEEGIIDVHVVLATGDLGHPQGTLDAPVPALAGPADGGRAGTWAASYRRTCAGTAQDGEVCVDGGAYWMGDPTFFRPYERLVAVSPFFVDETEVTVGQLRAAGFGADIVHSDDPASQQRFCTFTTTPGPFEDYPVTCLPRPEMLAYCKKRGGTLVSEAQWEYIGSARRSAPYVWGDDAPTCADAVYARFQVGSNPALEACKALGVGPQRAGSGKRDRFDLPAGAIVDLMGNVAELVQDDWDEVTAPCWNVPLQYDPLCVKPPPTAPPFKHTMRGNNFASSLTAASDRAYDPSSSESAASAQIGFRCARASD
jgi:formylglycine-generating enzyme required for sulfatase activity